MNGISIGTADGSQRRRALSWNPAWRCTEPIKDNGGREARPPRLYAQAISRASEKDVRLDDVDLGRQVARDFEADFLLANLRLVPDLHWYFLQNGRCLLD